MLKLKMTPLAFGLLFGLSFQIAAQSQQKAASAGNATISGRVVMKGEPAPNVLVYLHPQSSPMLSDPDGVLRARTDESGQFRITGVAAGDYAVTPLAPAFLYSAGDEPGPRGKMLKVSEGENIENFDIELYRGGVITGRVIDSQGRPLVVTRILLSRLEKDGWRSPKASFGSSEEMYQTDDRGIYRFYGLPKGRYRVSVGFASSAGAVTVSRSGTFYPLTFHPNAANESEARVIEVTEGSESANIDITVPELAPARAISGRVINADTGQSVEGIEIAYHATSGNHRIINHWSSNDERSGENGEFKLKGMAPGKYTLVVRPESENEFFSDPVICDLSKGDVSGLEIKVRQGGSISGVIVIEGTNDSKTLVKLTELIFYVHVLWPHPDAPRRDKLKINADGSFHIRGLPDGWARIQFASYGENGRVFSLARIEHNGAVLPEAIKAGPGKHVTGVRIVLVDNR